ncbi:oxidoreductase-like domain-containing protein [Paludibacterium yongneupense]|uniref:oxidoreductase-like domain-containing protein n=1 Tax=Paludibacterium yongneupense TaxID=400061 RepID=UPI0003F6A3EB|nr:oxidoreductase-like domain-containing protein [Paludibacterium yongneupense]
MPDELPPRRPQAPGDNECCGSGCDPCVWDLYREEVDRYAVEFEQWRSRHPCPPGGRDE